MERCLPTSYLLVFIWGLAVLVGLIGLGRVVALALGGEASRQIGWGLHAVWGMAAYLFLGGILGVVHACTAPAIALLIGVGVAVMLWTSVRAGWPRRESFAALPWQMWPAFLVVALMYAGGLFWQFNLNPADDLPAYHNFCEKLLATGSFEEPFSWRRLASLGGHTLLQCSILSQTSYASAQAFETALCPVILLGLILGFRDGALARSRVGLVVAMIALTTRIIRVNSASHLTGIVLFVGLFATLDLLERNPLQRRRWFAVAGFVAAAFCTLRAQNVPAAGAAIGLFWIALWVRDRPSLRTALLDAAACGAVLLIALLPWMIMSYVSNGSPLFPLFQGNNNAACMPQSLGEPLSVRLRAPIGVLFTSSFVSALLCLFALPAWRQAVAARAVAIAGVFAALLVAYTAQTAPDEFTIPRYVQPAIVSASFAALMAGAVVRRTRLAAILLATLVAATSLHDRGEYLLAYYTQLSRAPVLRMPFPVSIARDYAAAEALVPEGQRVLVATDFPFLFDHRTHSIWNIDIPHAASPPPGLPFQKPPEETKRYLRGLGIEYVIFMDFARSESLYSRDLWQRYAKGDVKLWKLQSEFLLDFMQTFERLSDSETVLGRAGYLTVLHLTP